MIRADRRTGRETVYLDMDHLFVLLLFLWSSGLQAEGEHESTEFVRLVQGDSSCVGTLQLKHMKEWRPVSADLDGWTLKDAAVLCRKLDCGFAVSVEARELPSETAAWRISSECVLSGSALRECAKSKFASSIITLTCSDSVRLVGGTSLCSGRLEVKSNQSDQFNQRWSSVCEDDFDLQDAEVVCRELGCGAPSVLQGALYGEVEAPMWTKEFQCKGHESALLDCRSSERNTRSPGRAAGLTCSEPVRLVGGNSRCAGTLEVKHQGEWRPVNDIHSDWTLNAAAVACKEFDCGSAVSVLRRNSQYGPVWDIPSECVLSGSSLRECATLFSSGYIIDLACCSPSGWADVTLVFWRINWWDFRWQGNLFVAAVDYSVRLVGGTSLCSGRLQVKSNQSDQFNQRWSSVCEDDFDLQDAEVVCRELGCGAPSVLQGGLYGEVEAPMWTKEFQCEGHESALLDCRSSERNTCSPGRAAGLTCSEPVRLVGGDSRCAGTLELEIQGEWRPLSAVPWTMKAAAVACRKLNCGSAVSFRERESSDRSAWWIWSRCVQSGSALRECARSVSSSSLVDLTCSDLLLQPNIFVSSSMDGVSEAQQQGFQVSRGSTFNISCSIQPQYPGGSFQLSFSSSNSAHNFTQPAVDHSAKFLFPAAEPAHHGTYSCVYGINVFSHDFSSVSRLLSVTVSDPTPFIIRAVVLPLLLLVNAALYFHCQQGAEGGQTGTTWSWIINAEWFCRLRRKELREQSSTSEELIPHPDEFLRRSSDAHPEQKLSEGDSVSVHRPVNKHVGEHARDLSPELPPR
ncbi:LOW QUALITY PROTEIN: scavenger receptor cysteine-rich type 1 protein M130-like [Plectropomus leopardus]|uniref:LOW QUALITY PROTEIN: scavenger receptor cysteine-rich type 1 protein M130-like n=1 Tax=Plectropomus leopardus TaxID=160734 RepID=UPI001C4D3EFF|nr:LOW QUALITY PROTEIN: scavenger receptor cysteine-rich type 1 protein M130-like [Plectropomus leopardus]